MERKTLVGMCFFLIVFLDAQEGMVEIEACEIPCILFDGECNSLQDNDHEERTNEALPVNVNPVQRRSGYSERDI
ncbi:hypothetical protein MtrunA17_Chr8g0337761 [Medicago truncatula]|uniref:Transmembrane protein n=1 Tax=Medicago truncatula TaxID=3880 RepID=A0A396GJC3_MEDTR|nr:hypothetical protein MtrunA17_Chr8g0337761 [Medicago truncatula]